jgi:NAD+ synthase (glutamine-hydrolysing)
MKIGFAQLNPTVGDLKGNVEKILQAYQRLTAAGAELVLTPELSTSQRSVSPLERPLK